MNSPGNKHVNKPSQKPQSTSFSSGPCAKRPDWSFDNLQGALLGRSHRSGPGKEKLKSVIDRHRELLGIPSDYHIGIVPASDTGAIEMAMWSMLGARKVDTLVWESFSKGWDADIKKHLKLDGVTTREVDYGYLPDLEKVDFENDVVFCWNGTTSGVRIPNGDWIPDDREGLTVCDATSAVFAYDMPWEKLDVTTWSWQKVLGGEAGQGMLVLSPRAVERLESYVPAWPLPKIFRMTKGGKLNAGIFQGLTINTPSMLAVEDCLDALDWVEGLGGAAGTINRSYANYKAVENWVAENDWIEFLAPDENVRSTTSITLKITDPWFESLQDDLKMPFINALCKALEKEDAAYDIKSYRDAPPGLRIWGGATIDTSDMEALLPWIEWAYVACKSEQAQKAA